MRDRRIPDVGHLAGTTNPALTNDQRAGTFRKETCRTCNCTVYIGPDGVATDSELIAVVLAGKGAKGRRGERANARRLHAETCESRAREARLEKLRAEKAEYARSKKPPEMPPIEQWSGDVRGAVVEAQSALRRLASIATKVFKPKRGRARSM